MQGTSSSDFYLHKDADYNPTTLGAKFETVQLTAVGSAAYVGGTFSVKPLYFWVQSNACDTAFNLRMGTALNGANGTVAMQINPASQPWLVPVRPNSTAPFECAAVSAAGTLNIQAHAVTL